MNEISEIQRMADAFAGLARNLADLVRLAGGGLEGQFAAQSFAPAQKPERECYYPDRYTPIPPNGRRCPYTGLSHAKLYQMLGSGGHVRSKVRVAHVRAPGKRRGQTLFHVGDMMRYLDELAAEQGTQWSSIER